MNRFNLVELPRTCRKAEGWQLTESALSSIRIKSSLTMLAAAWLLISGTSQIGFSRQAQEFDVAKAVKEWNYYEKEYTKTTAEATWLNSQSPTGEGKNITFSESANSKWKNRPNCYVVAYDHIWEVKGPANVIALIPQEYKNLIARSTREVKGYNPDYAFSLSRKQNDAPWNLDLLVLATDSEGYVKFVETLNAERLRSSPIYAIALKLADLVALPSFRILECSKIDSELFVSFECGSNAQHADPNPIKAGKLWLDLSNHWVIVRAEIEQSVNKGRETRTHVRKFEYEKGGSDIRFPVSHTGSIKEFKGPQGPPELPSSITMNVPRQWPATTEFRLPKFGFPEPYHRFAFPFWGYLAIVSVVIISITAFYYRSK